MAAWVMEEENGSETEGEDKVEVALGVIVESLRRFRVSLVILTQPRRTPKAGSTAPIGKAETVRVRCCRCYASRCKYEVVAIREGHRTLDVGTVPNPPSLAIRLFVARKRVCTTQLLYLRVPCGFPAGICILLFWYCYFPFFL